MFILATVTVIDKTHSKLYYPIINKSFILKKDLCLQKLENSIGIYSCIDNCKGIKLPKNSKITITQVIKSNFPLLPSYDVVIKTPIDKKIKEKFKIKEIKVFANSLFYEMGILKNIKITNFWENNFIIIVLYFLFLTILLIKIAKKYLLDIIVYIIAYYYYVLIPKPK